MSLTILCSSDDQILLGQLTKALRGYGDRILTATSPQQAIALTSIEHIDLIILGLKKVEAAYSTPANLKFVQPHSVVLLLLDDQWSSPKLPTGIDAIAQSNCVNDPELLRELLAECVEMGKSIDRH